MFGKRLEEFYAVTETSVYRVRAAHDDDGNVIIEKIALAGGSSVGLGQWLKGGSCALITREALHAVDSKLDPEECPFYLRHTVHTSKLIGIFLDKDEALNCFAADGLQTWDDRWFRQSNLTLKAIGSHHPFFRIYDGPLPGDDQK